MRNTPDEVIPPEVLSLQNPGVIYDCPYTSLTDDCVQINIDREVPKPKENKTDMWLGVSVSSQGTPDGMAVACAHRYRHMASSYCHALGMCQSISNALDQATYWGLCESKVKGHEYYGYCQAGASVDLEQGGDLLIGVPGPYAWRGALMKNIIKTDFSDLDNIRIQRPYWSPVETLNGDDEGPQPATDFYAYLGMSTKIGRLLNNETTYVGGAPRSLDMGQVLLFTQNPERLEIAPEHYLTGEKFGSYFGHDVTIIDLNGDEKNDLVVSAPFYVEKNVGGAIYVYMNSNEGISNNTVAIKIPSRQMGQSECKALNCENARFGFSLANIGDLNRDGFEDLAVGAPYEGNGAVYIFRGSSQGIIPEYSQRIAADDITTVLPLSTFGYSLSGGMDVDNSTYPDLLVGAYDSNMVVTLRSRPVVQLSAVVINMPPTVPPNSERCEENGLGFNCFRLRVCFTFSAKPESSFTEPIEVSYELNSELISGLLPRAYFAESITPQVLKGDVSVQARSAGGCFNPLVYIGSANKDFLNPLIFNLTYKLRPRIPPTMQPGDSIPDLNQYPVLIQETQSQVHLTPFTKSCGDDNKCDSNLHLAARFDNLRVDEEGYYVMKDGEKSTLYLSVDVTNNNEDAHETTFILPLPTNIDYSTTVSVNDKVQCDPIGRLVVCSVGNPIMSGDGQSFTLHLTPDDELEAGISTLEFNMEVNTTSEEDDPRDNVLSLSVRVIVETDLYIRGFSQPREVEFGGEVIGETAMKKEEDIGSLVVHTYEVVNDGSGTVANASVMILWPYELNNTHYDQGKHVLYLLQYPQVDPPAPCYLRNNRNYQVNPLGIEVNEDGLVLDDGIINGRQKREASPLAQSQKEDLNSPVLDCDRHSARCLLFECVLGKLEADHSKSKVIHMKSRLWNSTFLEEFLDVDRVHIYSKAWIHIPPQYNVIQADLSNDVIKVGTIVQPALVVQAPKQVPLWVIIVAALVGVFVLLLIIVLLWKCGFFKRQQQDEMKKHQAEVMKSEFNYD